MPHPTHLLPILLASAVALTAEVSPHPTQPGRLVDTRGDLAVEYSPGQEAWVEMGFVRLQALIDARANAPALPTPAPDPTLLGSVANVHAQRDSLLAATASSIGLAAPSDLQARTFDTFLGYYDLLTELTLASATRLPAMLEPRRVGIWQFDDLKQRLIDGAKIPGMYYDPATDRGGYDFAGNLNDPELNARIATIKAAIRQQEVKHAFHQDADGVSAAFSLTPPADLDTAPTPSEADTAAKPAPEPLIVPVVYRGAFDLPPDPAAFKSLGFLSPDAVATVLERASAYRDPRTVFVILHETIELGLFENIIRSPDRRWLCDGTANVIAWRIMRDAFGVDFANQGYDLDAQLRRYAPLQQQIDLVKWSATENQTTGDQDTALNKAHYAFATRAIFLLTAAHGEDALATLWGDVAAVGLEKASAKSFATALRKRYRANLKKLIRAAETDPIPPAPPSA
ncbi:hypothetical protein [Actomonas aquatica]|uniref:Transglycosylase SLT domain-containing protein n=1 Tax=Actomonas aquatica TaxID=2866162 RepID=A0ABZ1CE98_9BACT|nr:hypothetical protein [Opitutus sp. WL0086]WRQ89946.1 hypothetical protein K1X11_011055 [Opitutus sp. WL0086]